MRLDSRYSRLWLFVLISGLISLSCDSSVSKVGGTTTTPVTAFDVVTFHDDNARTGQDLTETLLTPDNVNQNSFGKVGFLVVDGKVDAQPLYLSNLNIPGQGSHSVVFVATEQDSIYAFDVDNGKVYWRSSLLGPGETTSDQRNCVEEISPGIGVTATPVIDRGKGPNGAIYVVGMSVDRSGNYFQRLHALDVTTGTELFGGPRTVTASYPGTGNNSVGGYVVFDPKQYKERAALLELNGVVYTTWASHCDQVPYTGWVMGFDASTLQQKGVLNVTPNGDHGGIWMSGSGPAADSSGNIYVLDGNGTFDSTLDANGFPIQGDFGNSFLKISTTGATLKVADYFVMFNQSEENSSDMDLGSGGTVLIPDQTDGNGQTRHLAVGAGKDGNMYIADRDSMGKYNPISDNIFQKLVKAFAGRVYSAPAYFNNVLYYGGEGDQIKAFAIKDARLTITPTSTTPTTFAYPGATPSISANGTTNGIVWAVENGYVAKLHAYDASNLSHELYNSSQAPYDRDQLGPGNKYITPTIANGKVFVGTTYGVTVYGLRQ